LHGFEPCASDGNIVFAVFGLMDTQILKNAERSMLAAILSMASFVRVLRTLSGDNSSLLRGISMIGT
jgi:hypothetical protein